MNEEIEHILEEAKKELKTPHYIVDLFDSRIIWFDSEAAKHLGYNVKDILFTKVEDHHTKPEEVQQSVLEPIVEEKGEQTFDLKTRKGKTVVTTLKFRTIKTNKGIYKVGMFTKFPGFIE